MPEWTTACPDWADRLKRKQSILPCGPLFPAEAEESMKVFRNLRLTSVAGKPTMGEASRPWVQDFATTFFGSYNPDSGERLIQNYMLLISKKNTKSSIAAGIMLTVLLRNWRHDSEFLILAPTKEVADNSFQPARNMVKADERLKTLLHVQDQYRTITHVSTGASLKVVAADPKVAGGKMAAGVLVDELWQFGAIHNADDMLLEAEGGIQSRDEGFVIYLTTHSSESPSGVFDQKLKHFRAVRDGTKVDRQSLPLLYEWPEEMIKSGEYRDPANWHITNPNLGLTAKVSYIQRKLDEAAEQGAGSVKIVEAKLLNVPVLGSTHGSPWAGAAYWQKRADKTLTLETLIERSEVIVVGIDGGGLDDLLGLAVMGREKGTRRWLLWCRAWFHDCVLERRKEIAPRLLQFVKVGEAYKIADESEEDVEAVVDIIEQVRDSGLLAEGRAIGVDPVGIAQIIDELKRRKFDIDEKVEPVRQGWTMSDKIKTTERRLAAGSMVHDGSGLMDWCIANAKVEPRGNAILITKAVSGTAKIDPLIAAFNAGDIMVKDPVAAVPVNVRAMVA